ncbi:hypothetical protein ACFQAS_01920 [Halopenitus salinus]|jgi:hypothetical protein|uniref:Lycopene cyclase domain-containing protein n=1 Tax=Halopenitus salinus TaxID=1198295 RepID=A0ABD5UV28_9EURY
MVAPIVFWSFIALKGLLLLAGGGLTVISYRTSRRNENASFRFATYAFLLFTAGVLLEGIYALYDLQVHGAYELVGAELLAINSAESVLILAGFGLFFYSIYSL